MVHELVGGPLTPPPPPPLDNVVGSNQEGLISCLWRPSLSKSKLLQFALMYKVRLLQLVVSSFQTRSHGSVLSFNITLRSVHGFLLFSNRAFSCLAIFLRMQPTFKVMIWLVPLVNHSLALNRKIHLPVLHNLKFLCQFSVNQLLLGIYAQPPPPVVASCSHIPPYLVILIVYGQFVKLFLLLPKDLAMLLTSVPNDAQLSSIIPFDLAKIMNFRELTAYTVIQTKKSSDVIQDLLAYFLLLTKTEREHPDCNWIRYDTLFRVERLLWKVHCIYYGLADQPLWMTHMLLRKVSESSIREIACLKFNEGMCWLGSFRVHFA